MITTRRQIRTASDRFGGYAAERPTVAADSHETAPADISSMKSYASENRITYSDPEPAVEDIRLSKIAARPVERTAEPEKPLYSTRETVANPIPERPEKVKTKLDREDLMPSVKTRRLAAVAPEDAQAKVEMSESVPVRREHGKLSPRTKILLFVYVAVALVLAIAVIATGVSISNASAEADKLAERVAQQTAELNALNAQISEATNPDELFAKATDIGMVKAGAPSESIDLVETIDYPTATPHTNGFDGFMDWFSKLLV